MANNLAYDRPDWDEYFISIAQEVSKRSTCLRRRYGAIIVNNRRIVSTGYNGAARGRLDCLERGDCKRNILNIPSGQQYELCESVHAEANAIINGNPLEMQGADLYIAGFEIDNRIANSHPCVMCERMIRNACISRVIYLTPDNKIHVMNI